MRDRSDRTPNRTLSRAMAIGLAAAAVPGLILGCSPAEPANRSAEAADARADRTGASVRTVPAAVAARTKPAPVEAVTPTAASTAMTPAPVASPTIAPAATEETTPAATRAPASKKPSKAPTSTAEPKDPEPGQEQTKTLCGTSFLPEDGQSSKEALEASDDRFGGLGIVRVFYKEPSPWPGRAGDPERPVVVSLKLKPDAVLAGEHDEVVSEWFETAPTDRDIYWSLHHEPEDNVEDGEFTTEEYRDAWRHIAALADAADNPKLHATLILMDWTLDSRSGRNWRDFYPGDDVIDVLGFDVYNHGYKSDPPTYYSAEKQLSTIVETAKEAGKPFGIAELGSVKVEGDSSGEGRAAWIRDLTSYLIEHDALWATYFDIDHDADSDYRLRDQPSIDAWRDFCG